MFNVKEAPWKVILVYLLVSMGMVMLTNLVLFPSTFFFPIAKPTSGLIDATLQADLPLDFALLFAWGLFFTAVYLLSGNLFLAIGVHALSNRPTLITEATFPPQALLFVLTCILLARLRSRNKRTAEKAAALS